MQLDKKQADKKQLDKKQLDKKMQLEDDLHMDPAVLERYEKHGYLLFDGLIGPVWLERLKAAATEFVEASRSLTQSSKAIDIAPGHTAEQPKLRRLVSPVDQHPTFYEFAIRGPMAQLACALLGGRARFHHSKLNYKWSAGGEEVKWHQDIQFWPHTDFSPLTIGVYLAAVDDEMGPMGVIPGSHHGTIYDLYDHQNQWAGAMREADIKGLELDKAVWLKGAAGSVTVHNACMIHGSMPNDSDRGRPLLLQTYSAIDSYPISNLGANSVLAGASGTVIEGPSDQRICIQGRQLRCAPDWSAKGGLAPTIFGSQQQKM